MSLYRIVLKPVFMLTHHLYVAKCCVGAYQLNDVYYVVSSISCVCLLWVFTQTSIHSK